MKIAFIGDSFCADTRQGTWPYLVRKQTKSTLVCKGKQGASQYTILKYAKKILLLKPDLVIFTHTDPYRLANRHDEPLGARPCDQNKSMNKIWTAGHLYYEHLMNFCFMFCSFHLHTHKHYRFYLNCLIFLKKLTRLLLKLKLNQLDRAFVFP